MAEPLPAAHETLAVPASVPVRVTERTTLAPSFTVAEVVDSCTVFGPGVTETSSLVMVTTALDVPVSCPPAEGEERVTLNVFAGSTSASLITGMYGAVAAAGPIEMSRYDWLAAKLMTPEG